MKQVIARMREVEEAVLGLDETVRGPAFTMMREYILFGDVGNAEGAARGLPGVSAEAEASGHNSRSGRTDFVAFMDRYEGESPSENAKAIAGYLYGQYGIDSFSVDEVRDLAAAAGVTIPVRIDKTFRHAAHEKKPLFKPAGAGRFRPTIHAEAYMKAKFGVKKGTKKRAVEA